MMYSWPLQTVCGLNISIYQRLSTLLQDELSPEDATVRAPIRSAQRVCIGIFKRASCAKYRVVGVVSKVSVLRCVNAFVFALTRSRGRYIVFPKNQEAAIADRLQTLHGYPQAFGAIDGSHIAINPPAVGLADYLNRKMFPSIVWQGLVDDRNMFLDISCKCPGSMLDFTVFLTSSLARAIKTNMPTHEMFSNGVDIPLHIMGDPAYALSKKIIKGYTGSQLTAEQEFRTLEGALAHCLKTNELQDRAHSACNHGLLLFTQSMRGNEGASQRSCCRRNNKPSRDPSTTCCTWAASGSRVRCGQGCYKKPTCSCPTPPPSKSFALGNYRIINIIVLKFALVWIVWLKFEFFLNLDGHFSSLWLILIIVPCPNHMLPERIIWCFILITVLFDM